MYETNDLSVYEGIPFGDILLNSSYSELTHLGFELGDSVDIRFSSGECLEDIPLLSGCILPEGVIYLNAPRGADFVRVEKRFGHVWAHCRMKGAETGRITLRKQRKFILLQKNFYADYSSDRKEYPSDEDFANYRSVSAGKIPEGRLYRSAGVLDSFGNKYKFIIIKNCMSSLLERDGIRFVLNMSYSGDHMGKVFRSGIYKGSYLQKLYEEGHFYSDLFPADFSSYGFRESLAAALRELIRHPGPYLIQCRAGLDRTGFVCCLLEALAGADQSGITDDYMRSYDCLCGITKQSDGIRYDTLRKYQLSTLLESLTLENRISRSITADALCSGKAEYGKEYSYSSAELSVSAERYLRRCGLSASEIERLKQCLTG